MSCKALLAMAGVVALAATSPSAQQTSVPPADTASPVALSPEKQAVIRDHVKRFNPPAADLNEPARVGMVVPPETDLLVLPEDRTTEVPTVTSYSYLVAGDVIAIVEPDSRKVIQLIKR
jgi:hypothetical protein